MKVMGAFSMQKYWTYILKSKTTGRYYIGSTNDLNRRLADHNRGKSKSVRGRGPFEIIYYEEYQTRQEAVKREVEIKNFKGGNKFKAILFC